jgi:uncharacterized Zn finger protein (UPF0148 family)
MTDKYCKNCGIPVTNQIERGSTTCSNCGELLGFATTETKEYLCTAKDHARKVLKEIESARNDDWIFIMECHNRYGRDYSPTTLLREREILQNPLKGDKECFPSDETRKNRRAAQVNKSHRFGGQTISEEEI